MRRGRVIGGAILLLLGALALGGCKQKEGVRCQLDSDCGDNLRCCVQNTTAARALGGVCTVRLLDPAGNVVLDKCELPSLVDSGPHLEARVGDKGAGEAGSKDAKVDRAGDRSVTAADKPPATPDKTGAGQ